MRKLVFINIFLLFFSFTTLANSATANNKKDTDHNKTEKTSVDPDKEKSDSLTIGKTTSPVIKKAQTFVGVNSYNPEYIAEQDTLDQSGSVVTFNFIQYIIQNFKFSEEVY